MHVGILQFCFNCRYFKQCRLRNNMNFHLVKGIKGINLLYNKLTRNSTKKFDTIDEIYVSILVAEKID